MKILKKIGWILVAILIIAQFFGPERNEGEASSLTAFVEETNPPENVQKILQSACYDCHSNVTEYPWYNKITPVNYWLNNHVKDGKKHLNFSEWTAYPLKRKEHKMEELWEEVNEKKMPLDSYTWTHADAKLSQEQIDAIVAWGKNVQADYKQQMTTE